MKRNENPMTETESLQLITSMINKAQNRLSENGFLYLLWGWVTFICCVVQFVVLYFYQNENGYYIWYLTWVAVFVYVYYLLKKRKTRRLRTYTDEIAGYVWLAFVVATSLLAYILISNHAIAIINPVTLVMYGIPTFLSGVILKFKPLMTGGICCWLLAAFSVSIGYEFQLLLMALAVVLAWLIPGYLLKNKFKNQS